LADIETDLAHLFRSWFNADSSSCSDRLAHLRAVLEKLIQYEAVHEIQGWNDLRRRLQADPAATRFPSGAARRAGDLHRSGAHHA